MSLEAFEKALVVFPWLLRGLTDTMLISVEGILFGFIIGALTGYVLYARIPVLRQIAGVYIWVIRGTPLIVQALYMYFVMPEIITFLLGQRFLIDSNLAGVIVISLNAGAFISAIVKGALESVDSGQMEAGKSLGLSGAQILFHLIVPPAFKSMLPALFNQFIITVKDTALLSIISVSEITRQTQNYVARTFLTVPAYTYCALFYLALISVLMVCQKFIEKKYALK